MHATLLVIFIFSVAKKMALSLDDRILGEKVDNYCSSDEGEQDEDKPQKETEPKASSIPEPQLKDYNKFSTNVSQFFLI